MLHATGNLSLTMVMNLKRFVERGTASGQSGVPTTWSAGWRGQTSTPREYFDRIRGSDQYADALRDLSPASSAGWEEDLDAGRWATNGHRLGVFRQHLLSTHFFPTYCLNLRNAAQPFESRRYQTDLATELQGWTVRLRLTRNGLVVVLLERAFTNAPFDELIQRVHDIHYPQQPPTAAHPRDADDHYILAMDVVACFVQACGFSLPISRAPALRLTADYDIKQRLPLHDRYVTFTFESVTQNGHAITPHTLAEHHMQEVVGLLEQVVFVRGSTTSYPTYKNARLQAIADADTAEWDNELCILTATTGLIYYDTRAGQPAVRHGGRRFDPLGAKDYWLSVRRGIEHVLVVKNEVQLLERDTSRLLQDVPGITQSIVHDSLRRSTRRDMRHLSERAANVLYALPHLRDALVPSSMFRSPVAVQTFQRLMQIMGIYEIEEHIETNMQELNAFLAHFDDAQLHYSGQWTTVVFSLVALVLSALAFPQVIGSLIDLKLLDETRIPIVLYGFAVLFGVLMLGLLLRIAGFTRRRP